MVDSLVESQYNKHIHTQKGLEMKAFIVGTVFGLILATVGFSGLARMVDNGVSKVQDISKEAAK